MLEEWETGSEAEHLPVHCRMAGWFVATADGLHAPAATLSKPGCSSALLPLRVPTV